MLSYPSGMTVSSRALGVLSDALRAQRNQGLADVAVHRRGADLEPAGQVGVGLALAQVGQDKQGVAAGGQLAPPSPALTNT